MPTVQLTADCCPRRQWGKTGLFIPVVPFGTQGFGNHFGPVSDEEATALIRRAVDLGVNHFDTARCYGDSLRKLGVALQRGAVRREEIIISGRLCCHSGAPWGGYGQGRPDYSAERAFADIEDQLRILGADYYDVVFIHDPGDIEATLAPGGCLEALHELKSQGVVRHFGYGMRPHESHLRAIAEGDIDVLLTFNDFNLLRQSAAADILPAAAEKNLGVLNGWSIMRGLLTGTPIADIARRNPRLAESEDGQRAERMRLWCQERGISLLALAIQFCLREPRIHGNPIGSLDIQQLEANVRAAMTAIPEGVFADFAASGL